VSFRAERSRAVRHVFVQSALCRAPPQVSPQPCAAHSSLAFALLSATAFFLSPAGRRIPAAPGAVLRQWCNHQQTPQGQSACGLRLKASPRPRPNPAALVVRGSQSLRSLLVPVLAISAPCGPRRGPPCYSVYLRTLPVRAPVNPRPPHRQAVQRSRVIDKNRSGRERRLIKRVMAAADAAAMMRGPRAQ